MLIIYFIQPINLKYYHLNTESILKLRYFHSFFHTKPAQSEVCFTFIAHLHSDSPHFKCSITAWGWWPEVLGHAGLATETVISSCALFPLKTLGGPLILELLGLALYFNISLCELYYFRKHFISYEKKAYYAIENNIKTWLLIQTK